MESVWSVSKLSTESVVANCVHTADADATKPFRRADATRLDSFVSSASAVCIGLKAVDCIIINVYATLGLFNYRQM